MRPADRRTAGSWTWHSPGRRCSTGDAVGAVSRSVGTLSAHLLRQLEGRVGEALVQGGDTLDPYSAAHLEDARSRIRRALEAVYVTR